jgi:hypothetical protein
VFHHLHVRPLTFQLDNMMLMNIMEGIDNISVPMCWSLFTSLWYSPQRSVIQRRPQSSCNIYFYPQNNPDLLSPVEFNNIRSLTSKLHEKISSGTLNSPSWDLIRTAKLAARMYAPLGTMMSLGDHVRIIRAFLEAFKIRQEPEVEHWKAEAEEIAKLQTDLKVRVFMFVLKLNFDVK